MTQPRANVATAGASAARYLYVALTTILLAAGSATESVGHFAGTNGPHAKLGFGSLGQISELDSDGDTLPNAWETFFGLNPNDPADATLDPDGDGLTNLQELASSGHPQGLDQRYFAEGATGFFDTSFGLVNLSATDTAHVLVTFLTDLGETFSSQVTLEPRHRQTVSANMVLGGLSRAVSTIVESDVPIVADRLMRWGENSTGSSLGSGVEAPATSWYLAESATGSFSLFYLLQNPGFTPASVTVRYLRDVGPPITKTYTIAARSRRTIWVNQEDPGLLSAALGAVISATQPIVVERAMYLDGAQIFEAGSVGAGLPNPAATWHFAEGATGPFFDEFLALLNPSATTAATATVRFYLENGATLSKSYVVDAEHRRTVWLNLEAETDPALAALATGPVWLSVVADQPIVAERAMWWPHNEPWYGGHAAPGSIAPETSWVVPSVGTGGPGAESTYVLIANPSPFAATAQLTLVNDAGSTSSAVVGIGAFARVTVDVAATFGLASGAFSLFVESQGTPSVPLVVNYSRYSSGDGRIWTTGATARALSFIATPTGTAPSIISAGSVMFAAGTPSLFTVTATGDPLPSIALAGSLPAGITFAAGGNATATLSGTPSAGSEGIYPLTFTASNGVGSPAVQNFTLTVLPAGTPIFTSANAATFTVSAVGSFTVLTTADPVATLTMTGSLPSGVTFVANGDGTATLAGSPNVGTEGTYPLTFTADNGVGVAAQTFTLTVDPIAGGAPTFTSGNTATFAIGVAGSFSVTTTAFPVASTIASSGGLPNGITFTNNGDGTATLAGTAGAGTAGAYPLQFTADNGVETATQLFTLTVTDVSSTPVFTSATTATFLIGTAGGFTITTAASPAVSAIALTGALPAFLVFTDNGDGTATLSGTPQPGTGGPYLLTFTATNGVGAPVQQTFTLSVQREAHFITANNKTFTVGVPDTFTVIAAGPPIPTLSQTGALPGGLTYSNNGDGTGTISGTAAPGTNGTYPLTFTAVNGVGAPAVQAFTLNVIDSIAPTLDVIADPAAINEDAPQQTVNLTGISAGAGETQPLQVTASSNNLALIPNPTVTYTTPDATGSLSYTPVPEASGLAIVTVTVTDGGLDLDLGTPTDNGTFSRTFTVVVNAVNDTPTLDAIADPAAVLEDAPTQVVSLTGISAGGVETQPLQVTTTSGDTAVIPHPTVTYTSPSATGSLGFTPVADTSGTSLITVTVTDGGLDNDLGTAGDNGTVVRTFTVTVTAVDDPPTLDAISDPAAIDEDAAQQTVNLTGISAGGGESQTLTVTALSNNTLVIPNPTVTYTSPNAAGSLAYTPVAGASGTAIVTVTVDDGTAQVQRTFNVTVNAVNDEPTLDPIADPAAIVEDAAQQTVNLTGISAGTGETQTLQVTATSGNTAVIPDPAVTYLSPNATGSLAYTPVANAFGTAVITVTVTDGGLDDMLGTPGDNGLLVRTFTVTVNEANDPPTLDVIADPAAILEDATQQTVNLSGISAGSGETQVLQVTASSGDTAVIPHPTVTYTTPNATGSLAYTPVANAFGSAVITVTVTDGGLDNDLGTAGDNGTFVRTFTVNVTSVNDLPTISAGATILFAEGDPATVIDSGILVADDDDTNFESATVQIAANFASGQDVLGFVNAPPIIGSLNPAGDTLTLVGSATKAQYQAALRSVTYFNNSNNPSQAPRTVTWTVNDGTDNSASATSTINVLAVNDAPTVVNETFELLGNTELRVDMTAGTTPHTSETTSGVSSVEGVLDNDSDPEADPFAVTAITNCADASAPFDCTLPGGAIIHVDANGEFSYTPAPGASSGSFTYTVTDTPGQGLPASVTGTVTFTFFDMIWYVDGTAAGPGNGTSIDPFDTFTATNLNGAGGAGDQDDLNDYIFVHDSTINSGIELELSQHLIAEFVGLSIDRNLNGNGTPTVVAPANGARSVINGGAGNAVAITSAMPTEVVGFALSSTSANAIDLTTAAVLTGSATLTIGNNEIVSAGAEGIDVNLNAGTTGTLMLVVLGNSWNTALTHIGNGVDINRVAGTLNLNFSSNVNIKSNGTAVLINGGAVANMTITGFSNNSVFGDTVGAGVNISNVTFDSNLGVGGAQQVDGDLLTIGTAANPVGGAGVTLTTVQGSLFFDDLDVFAGNSGLAATGTGTGLTLAVAPSTSTISAVGGPAMNINTAAITLQLASLLSTNTLSSGVSLTTVSGTFDAPTGSTITKSSGAGTAFLVDNSAAGTTALTSSYAGTITNSSATGSPVSINTADTGSTVTFTGAITGNTGLGISLTNNTGATITLAGGLVLSTGTNPAFTATGGGTIAVCDENPCNPAATGALVNTLTTTTGTALNVANTTIGANRLEYRSISSNGGSSNAIILDTTGASGGLTVTGDGSNTSVGGNSSGGTITSKSGTDGSTTTGSGIYLNSTANIILRRMTINGTNQNFGIRGVNVNGFTMEYTTVTGSNGDNAGLDEGSANFDNLTGAAAITSSVIEGGLEDNLNVVNTTGTLNRLMITGSTFGFNNTVSGNNNILIESQNAGTTLNFTIQSSTIKGARADWINASNNSTSTMNAIIGGTSGALGNTFDNLGANAHAGAAAGGNRVVLGSIGTLTFDVNNNTLRGSKGEAIRVRSSAAGATTGTATGYVRNNVVGIQGTANSGSSEGSGIFAFGDGGSDMTIAISGNTVYQYNNHGIRMDFGDEINDGSVFNATVTGNTVSTPGNINTDFNAISLNHGTVGATDNFSSCVDIGGAGALANNVSNSGSGTIPPNNADIRLRQRQSTTVRLPGYGGVNNDDAAVVTYLTGRNTLSTAAASNTVPTGGGFIGGAACTLPPF